MPKPDKILHDVELLIASVKPQEAEAKLRGLIQSMGDESLRTWEADVRVTIGRFLPKRRRALLDALDNQLAVPAEPGRLRLGEPESPQVPNTSEFRADFENDLADLSDKHIFQWSTFYRDTLSGYFDAFVEAASIDETRIEALSGLVEPLALHSREIFAKGFRYQLERERATPQYAITRSLNGLQRFLDLPIEFLTANDATADLKTARALRAICSAMLRGILEGYTTVTVGAISGERLLPKYPRSWAHGLAFMTDLDVASVVSALEPGDFRDGVTRSVRPLIQALDQLAESSRDYVPLTALAQFNWDLRRLDLSIQPPPYAASPQLIDLQCYLDGSLVSPRELTEATSRNVAVLVAPMRPDLRAAIAENERLKRVVVAAAEDEDRLPAAHQAAYSSLEFKIYQRRSPRMGAQPLEYNFARDFPLHNPFLTRYFHVYRSSVRELLRAFERRNGVRLWCSVRRSGKTTACLDLTATSGNSVIVTQTCETTGQIPDGSRFYDSICTALEQGRQLPSSYFDDLVRSSAETTSDEPARIVFVLDEYETLFGRLKSAIGRDPDLRYAVVQPLLNQMVNFTRDNLLVFLGQQPNAHYILMDQNQLSAYVEQDSFPLFEHDEGSTSGELATLVRKVLTEKVTVDSSFVHGVHEEAAGHPFLTVNLLVEFVEWLIDRKRPVNSLQLDGDDIQKFAKQRLRQKELSLSPEYRFFREAIAEALGPDGRNTTPWLHGMYSCIRGIVRASPETLSCTLGDFENLVERANLPEIGMDSDFLLRTGQQSNFLELDGDNVRPKIRLLARLGAVTRGRVTA